MKTIFHLIYIISFSLIVQGPMQAQFGGLKDKIAKRTKDKLERKAEQKLVEEISEELARRAFKPIDKAMDNMLRSSYEEENGGEVDWENDGGAFQAYLESLNKSASVPASYTFDVQMEMEIKDYEKEKHEMTYLFSKTGAYFGIIQYEDKKETMMVFDNENNVMVIYSEDDGDKTAQAVPSMMNLAGVFVAQEMEKEGEKKFDIKKTGKTKKIAGYQTDEYEIDSEDDFAKCYIAKEFPVSFAEAMGSTIQGFLPPNYSQTMDLMDGMVLESEHNSKKDKKKKSTMKTKKVKEETFTIDNSDYGLAQM